MLLKTHLNLCNLVWATEFENVFRHHIVCVMSNLMSLYLVLLAFNDLTTHTHSCISMHKYNSYLIIVCTCTCSENCLWYYTLE